MATTMLGTRIGCVCRQIIRSRTILPVASCDSVTNITKQKAALTSCNNGSVNYVVNRVNLQYRATHNLAFKPPSAEQVNKVIDITNPGRAYVTHSNGCWKCGRHLGPSEERFICVCGVIQAPNYSLNHFEVMGIKEDFQVDTKLLTSRFRNLQRFLHPDKHAQKSSVERDYSAQLSSQINKAYSTLISPLRRGLYMLELQGQALEEGDIQVDPVFLMEIMETNELLSETTSMEKVQEIAQKNKAKLDRLMDDVARAFSKGHISKAKEILTHIKYYANIDDKIKEIENKNADQL